MYVLLLPVTISMESDLNPTLFVDQLNKKIGDIVFTVMCLE